MIAPVKGGMLDALRCMDGGWSTMRITTMLICLVVLVMWVSFCFVEGRLIPITWEMVTLLGGSQGAKALQTRFEIGKDGLNGMGPPHLREMLGGER